MSAFSKEAKKLSNRLQEISEASFDPEKFYCKRGRHAISKHETMLDRTGRVRCRIHGQQVRPYKILGNTKEGTDSVSGQLKKCRHPYMRCTSQFISTNYIALGKARLNAYCIELKYCLLDILKKPL